MSGYDDGTYAQPGMVNMDESMVAGPSELTSSYVEGPPQELLQQPARPWYRSAPRFKGFSMPKRFSMPKFSNPLASKFNMNNIKSSMMKVNAGEFGWRWLFVIPIMLVLVTIVLSILFSQKFLDKNKSIPIWLITALSGTTLSCLTLVVSVLASRTPCKVPKVVAS